MIEVVTFTGTLTHAGKHGETRVLLGDVVDEFHHVHGLAYTRTTEQTHFTALGERTDQVNHLDTGFKQFKRWRQFVKGWSSAQFDAIYQKAMTTVVPAEHERLLREATAIAMADVAISSPSMSAPESPMNSFAGLQLSGRKPMHTRPPHS